MLGQRILTALVLIPLFVAAVLYLDNEMLAAIFAVVVLLGGHEMARLAGLTRLPAQLLYLALIALGLWAVWRYWRADHLASAQWVIAAWWLMMTVALVVRRRTVVRIEGRRPTVLLMGGLVLLLAWASVVGLHASQPNGPVLVLTLFVLIWGADSFAYFAGRAFGRRKLSPLVSPGKTWAGVAGAIGGALAWAIAVATGGWTGTAALPPLLVLSVLVTAVSIGGDLWESLLKREAGVKDSGRLVPGHGGVLDRIDSVLAAAPVFALGIGLIGSVGAPT